MVRDQEPLGTKSYVPRLPEPLVSRPRLEKLLADGVRRPVTLVSGPPGAGKTTLLTSWLAGDAPPHAAWLSLDQRDDQPGRLAALVVAALVEAECVELPASANPASADRRLDLALAEIERCGRRCVLILDDVQELRSRPGLEALARLVEQAPQSLDVVLSSRADPPVGLKRLRLAGRLGEVRYTDLCFSRGEAAELFAAHELALSEPQTRSLWELLEGWAAGLRLAACALRREPDPSEFLAGAEATKAAVADYLLEEVLAREDDATQAFLLRTSVAERLTADLAIALTGDERAGRRLVDFERSGLFLVELDPHRCYRYHALFRTLLQAHLRQRNPGLARELHETAAAWHVARGQPAEAEEHARAAGDWRLVGRLVVHRWLVGTTEETDPLATDPLAGIPPAAVLDTPELAVVAAAEACRWANRKDAELYRARLDHVETTIDDEAFRRTWTTARRVLDMTCGWTFGADRRARAAVDSLQGLDTSDAWTSRVRQLAVLAQAEMEIDDGRLDSARSILDGLGDHGDAEWHRVLAAAILALLDAAVGNVLAADERLSWVRRQLETGAAHPTTARFAQAAAIVCAGQQGELHGMSDAVSKLAGGSREWSSRSLRCVDRVLQASTRGRAPFFVSLDSPTARQPLAERVLVSLGVFEVVDAKGRPIVIGGDAERAVTQARRRLAGARVDTGALPVGAPLDEHVPRHPRTELEATVLAAIMTERCGDRPGADRLVGEALDASAATGIRAPLLDHGRDVVVMLERASRDTGPRGTMALDLLDRLRHPGGGALVEPLTDREVAVLQHLPALMSNAEIAQGLHVSVNTVKTHLKAVYRKLGVEGRREAVLRGKDLELL